LTAKATGALSSHKRGRPETKSLYKKDKKKERTVKKGLPEKDKKHKDSHRGRGAGKGKGGFWFRTKGRRAE